MSGSEKNLDNLPATWEDEKAIVLDWQLWLQSDLVEYSEDVLKAFRIGWKAGARQATVNMWHWIDGIMLGHARQEGCAGPDGGQC